MRKTRTYTVPLARWFPADDPIAIAVAKLCILREDYFLELQGLVVPGPGPFEGTSQDKGIPGLDENSYTWRLLYFFRGSMRTLSEIRNLTAKIHTNKTDKKALAHESKDLAEGFRKLEHQLRDDSTLVKELRDSLGGHVLQNDLTNVLEGIEQDLTGLFQDGEITGSKRYKFTSQLVIAMMLEKVDPKTEGDKLEALLTRTSGLIKVITTMDEIIRAYIISRKLLN